MEARAAGLQVRPPPLSALGPRSLRRPRRLDAGCGPARPRQQPRTRRRPRPHRANTWRPCNRAGHHQARVQVPDQEPHGPARMRRLRLGLARRLSQCWWRLGPGGYEPERPRYRCRQAGHTVLGSQGHFCHQSNAFYFFFRLLIWDLIWLCLRNI